LYKEEKRVWNQTIGLD